MNQNLKLINFYRNIHIKILLFFKYIFVNSNSLLYKIELANIVEDN